MRGHGAGYGTKNVDGQDNCITDGGWVGAQALSSAVGVAQKLEWPPRRAAPHCNAGQTCGDPSDG